MKKSELKVGEEYAVGGTSSYDTKYRVSLVGVDVELAVKAHSFDGSRTVRRRGIVVELHPELESPRHMRGAVCGVEFDRRFLLASARYVHATWAAFVDQQERAAVARQTRDEEEARRRKQLADVLALLRDRYGVRIERDDDRGTVADIMWDASHFDITMEAEFAERLFKRIDPLEVAGSAIEEFIKMVCDQQPYTGLHDLAKDGALDAMRSAALEEVRQGLAVSDHEIEAT